MALVDREIQVNDGIAVMAHGDVLLVVYQAAARLHRTRWAFDAADELATQRPGGILVLLVVLSTADPPDAPTRTENHVRFKKLRPSLRKLVTVPVGDALWLSLVRTIMRGVNILQGASQVHVVADNAEGGIARLLQAAGPGTPTRAELVQDLRAICKALNVPAPMQMERPPSAGA